MKLTHFIKKYYIYTVYLIAALLTQVNLWQQSNQVLGPHLLHVDEISYLTRAQKISQGQIACSPWSGRNLPCLVPTLPEKIWASSMGHLPINLASKLMLFRMLALYVSMIVLHHLFTLLQMPLLWSLSAISALFLSSSSWNFTPLLDFFNSQYAIQFNRFLNPLLPLPLFFIAALLFLTVLKKSVCLKTASIKEQLCSHHYKILILGVLASLFLSSLFYTSVYYWTHLGAWMFFLLIYQFFAKRPIWPILGIGFTSLVLAIPWLYHFIHNSHHPLHPLVLWRNGLGPVAHFWALSYSYSYKLMLVQIPLALIFIFYKPSEDKKILGLGLLSGLFSYYLPILFKLEMQNFHYKYTLIPLSLGLLFYLVYTFFGNRSSRLKTIIPLLILLLTFLTPLYKLRLKQEIFSSEFNIQSQDLMNTFQFIKNNEGSNHILAERKKMLFIPLMTNKFISLDSPVEYVEEEELMWQNFLYWRLKNYSQQDILDHLKSHSHHSIASWGYGSTLEMRKEALGDKLFVITSNDRQKLASLWAKKYSETNDIEILSKIQGHPLDTFISEEGEGWDQAKIDFFFNRIKMTNFGAITVYKVDLNKAWASEK